MNRRLRPLTCLCLLAALSAASWAQAADPRGQSPAPSAQQGQRTGDPKRDSALPDSVRRVEQNGGEVLRAEPMQRDGREVYRIKVLTSDGRVRVMQDDPGSRRDDRRSDRDDDRRDSGRDRRSRDNSQSQSPPAD